MTDISIKALSNNSFKEITSNISIPKLKTEDNIKIFNNDNSSLNKKISTQDLPFSKKINITSSDVLNNKVSLEKELNEYRENKNSQGIFKIAKIQYEKNILPNTSASDLLRESYELALSEMDSDTLYDIANFDASKDLLKDISSEHIFKMADMTRKIY